MHAGKYLPGLIAFAAFPAHAQQASPTPTPAPPPITTIPALIPERFSIGPPTQLPTPAATPTPAPTPPSAAKPTPRATAPVRARPTPQATQPAPTVTPAALPPSLPAPVATLTPVPSQIAATPLPAPAAPQPWLWALFGAGATVAAGLAAWLVLRRRSPAEDKPVLAPDPIVAPLPPVRGPSPRVTPPPATEPFELAVQPLRLQLGETEILIELELLIANVSGTAADGVRLSAAAISASPRQDADLAAFQAGSQLATMGAPFDLPAGGGGRLPIQLALPRGAVHVVDLGGRAIFVPIVAIDLRWRGGLSIRRFSASFMLGGAGQGGKPAPIRLDRGQPRGPFAATRYQPAA